MFNKTSLSAEAIVGDRLHLLRSTQNVLARLSGVKKTTISEGVLGRVAWSPQVALELKAVTARLLEIQNALSFFSFDFKDESAVEAMYRMLDGVELERLRAAILDIIATKAA